MKILLTILAFNFIIIIHELGHFIVAKLSGIKVQEFSLFIGPKLFSIQRGETVYSLRLIPVIAYVKMEGEDEEAVSDRSFSRKPLLTRAAVIAAGPLANLIACAVFLWLSFSFSADGYDTTKLGPVEKGSPAYEAGLQKGDEILKYDGKRTYQQTDVAQFLYVSKGKPVEIEFLRGNEKKTVHIVPEINPIRYSLGFIANTDSTVIKELVPKAPLEKIGAKPGDRIIKLNDLNVQTVEEIREYLKENKEIPINLLIVRDNKQINFNITPQVQEYKGQYNLGTSFISEKGNMFQSFKQAVAHTYSYGRNVAFTLVWLVKGQVNFGQMMGPVGIFATMNEVVKQSPTARDIVINLLNITAFISAAIGATNLIPFPALDGSKLLLLGVEGIRRKPIPVEKEAIITMVGFVLLLALAIFTTSNDLIKLVSGTLFG